VAHLVADGDRPIPRLPFLPCDLSRHVSAVDWAGIAQRLADAVGVDHPARAEFDYAMSIADVVDLQDGGSVTVLKPGFRRGVRS
jgi:hypothetical protein